MVLRISAGEIIAGRYRVESLVGKGGMALVYKAQHIGTHKTCALKFMRPRLIGKPQLLKEFLKEA